MVNFKEIHIGQHLKRISEFKNLSITRACAFLECSKKDIEDMYAQPSMDSQLLLKWCKLLNYNFFMFYHTHLQIYKPQASTTKLKDNQLEEELKPYVFRKNLYSPELIDWVLEQLRSQKLSAKDIIDKYQIPKTTLYRWKKRL